MTSANNLNLCIKIFRIKFCIRFLQSLSKNIKCNGGCFLNEKITIFTMFKSINNKINSIIKIYPPSFAQPKEELQNHG